MNQELQQTKRYAVGILMCCCLLGLVPVGHGQTKSRQRVSQLISQMRDPDSDVRRSAVDALSQIGAPAVDPLIVAMLDKDPRVRQGAARALGDIGEPRAEDSLISALKDPEAKVRLSAAEALGDIKDPRDARVVDALIIALKDEDSAVRSAATKALDDLLRWDPSLSCSFSQEFSVQMNGLGNGNVNAVRYSLDCQDKEGTKRSIELVSDGSPNASTTEIDGKIALKTRDFGTILKGNKQGTFDKYEMTENQIRELRKFLGFQEPAKEKEIRAK